MAKHLQNYTQSLDKLKADLKTRMLPAPPLAPNEFQSRLRQAMTAVADKARANRVKLPENFLRSGSMNLRPPCRARRRRRCSVRSLPRWSCC